MLIYTFNIIILLHYIIYYFHISLLLSIFNKLLIFIIKLFILVRKCQYRGFSRQF